MALLVFIILAAYHNDGSGFVQTQEFKYPPRAYYISYAFFALNTVYLLVLRFGEMVEGRGIVLWLSDHSLWIYLWHIAAIYLLRLFPVFAGPTLMASIVRSGFLLFFGVLMTVVQVWIVRRISAFLDRRGRRRLASSVQIVLG
jgi:hypothetical protein